jgi:hypothetical protein
MRLHTLNRLMADAQLSDLPGLIEQALRIDDDLSAALLDRDLEELRRELKLEPVRQGLPSWYSRPELMAVLA